MWHALKGYKAHLGTKFGLNASKIEGVLKKNDFFTKNDTNMLSHLQDKLLIISS